ncbi:hypothetical protein M2302_006015 [Micromonospora sp. A200]|nr:hypothetical protein [Micromonospora sp. A200]
MPFRADDANDSPAPAPGFGPREPPAVRVGGRRWPALVTVDRLAGRFTARFGREAGLRCRGLLRPRGGPSRGAWAARVASSAGRSTARGEPDAREAREAREARSSATGRRAVWSPRSAPIRLRHQVERARIPHGMVAAGRGLPWRWPDGWVRGPRPSPAAAAGNHERSAGSGWASGRPARSRRSDRPPAIPPVPAGHPAGAASPEPGGCRRDRRRRQWSSSPTRRSSARRSGSEPTRSAAARNSAAARTGSPWRAVSSACAASAGG